MGVRYVGATGKRYRLRRKLIEKLDGGLISCSYSCISQNCISFNHNDIEKKCEIFSWAQGNVANLTSDVNWNYYVQKHQPLEKIRDPCASSPCPEGSMCVRYTQPVFDHFVTDLDFYICTRHHLLNTNGLTKCYFKIIYGVNYPGFDIHGYRHLNITYKRALELCNEANCASIFCNRGFCWLKSDYVGSNGTLKDYAKGLYFQPICE
ncbi:uncharacterized protein LOC143018361 [Oratosquilla oratoria]|uniref:uncharacterized protein LOC143018361 n=1 Tax=Oratosquilla oratoria TaxID=337810 RepID=UPI003F75F272